MAEHNGMSCIAHTHNNEVRRDSRLRQLCNKLVSWIATNENIDRILIPYIVKDEHVSKRLIYWTISKYAKTNTIPLKQMNLIMTNIYQEYTNYLRSYNRRLFDTFCRQPYTLDLELTASSFEQWKALSALPGEIPDSIQKSIYNYVGGRWTIRTSLGQLNFFYWASTTGILDYVTKHAGKLMSAMQTDSKEARKTRDIQSRKRRRIGE
jgi:hypothetical protein